MQCTTSTTTLRGGCNLPKAPQKYSTQFKSRMRNLCQRNRADQKVLAGTDATTSTAKSGQEVSREENWGLWRNRLQGESPEGWAVYGGVWNIWTNADLSELKSSKKGLRCFRAEGEGFKHINILDQQVGPGLMGTPRPNDEWFSSEYPRTLDQSTFATSLLPTEEENVPGRSISRLLAASAEAYAVIGCQLPLPIIKAESASPTWPPPPKDQPNGNPPNFFHYEVFLHDGQNRWSIGGTWDFLSGDQKMNFLIREYERPGAEPADTLPPPADLELPKARPALDGLSAVQQLQAAKTGCMCRVTFDDSGTMFRDAPQADVTAPPLQNDTSYRLICFPDQMFAHVPEKLPKAGQTGGNPCRFTWGGAMRGSQFGYLQMQATYCGTTGRLIEMTSFTTEP